MKLKLPLWIVANMSHTNFEQEIPKTSCVSGRLKFGWKSFLSGHSWVGVSEWLFQSGNQISENHSEFSECLSELRTPLRIFLNATQNSELHSGFSWMPLTTQNSTQDFLNATLNSDIHSGNPDCIYTSECLIFLSEVLHVEIIRFHVYRKMCSTFLNHGMDLHLQVSVQTSLSRTNLTEGRSCQREAN